MYREWGWEVFQAIEHYCKTEVAFGSHPDVTDTKMNPKNELESYFFAETLKYLYLLYDPDTEIDILKKVCLIFTPALLCRTILIRLG